MTYSTPLSAGDLTEIAKRLRQWERLMVNESGYTDRSNLVERIEIHRPDSPGDVIGHFVLVDEWVGFQPIGESK